MADPKEKEQPIASVVNPRSFVVPFPEPRTKCISDTNSNSEPSMDSITEEPARLFYDSLAGNTRKSYPRARSVLDSFQLLYTLDKVWPVPVEQLVQFIAYLSLKHYSPATVRLYISGISFSHKERNLEDTTKNFVVSKMLGGLHTPVVRLLIIVLCGHQYRDFGYTWSSQAGQISQLDFNPWLF
ncbi:Hypothetical predicted protein [Mytilus galloprovincialis]|uniref:Core-binding (CB) domain-containing protein n=1 Tax=Mytilus galloprovincialis TaxID=29158 RepID=A0A8B6GNE4_MYTGA|nr:Hypothetical predicted protein [Mytilus galloprovincialis]